MSTIKPNTKHEEDRYKILGLDVGIKRIGLAIYRKELAKVYPLPTIKRTIKTPEMEIIKIIDHQKITSIVVGIPLSSINEPTDQEKDIRSFTESIKNRCNIEIFFEDEYLSSEDAKEILEIYSSPSKLIRESGYIDAISASIILKRYLIKQNLNPEISLGDIRKRISQLKNRS